jgi:predicted lysophospholipase L1 biosynthesis ABC-type transport system permease subunit
MQRQVRLPLRKAIQIAWRNIRVRWWRSMLVTSGIILALAFLTYVLTSEALADSVRSNGSPELVQNLTNRGALTQSDADSQARLWWMVGLALLIAFVGILNAMLMSVTERFAEIGTMKCLGALDGFIIKLFLLESTFQGISGTAIGIVLGLVLALVEGFFSYGAEAGGLIPMGAIVRFTGLCLIVGIILTILGALYPAWRAARMQPVDAMRAEV